MNVTRDRPPRRPTPALGQPRLRVLTPAAVGVMGRYRLFERIRVQELGDTFVAATQGVDGTLRHVVLKRLHPALAASPPAVRRFIDEARLQSKLLHPHIVQVVAFGTEADQHFLAYEHVQGKQLERIVRRHMETFGKPLPVAVAAYILYGVIEALAYVHSRVDENRRRLRIIHGNVNPSNVLVSFRGEVKVSEFAGLGISGGVSGRPRPDRVVENTGFMSPEQARGEPADARSDQFSAALLLYYCLTGQSLWETNQTALRRIGGPDATAYRSDPRIPPPIAELLKRALAIDSSARFVTARELGRKLGAHFIAGRHGLAELMIRLFPEPQRPGGAEDARAEALPKLPPRPEPPATPPRRR